MLWNRKKVMKIWVGLCGKSKLVSELEVKVPLFKPIDASPPVWFLRSLLQVFSLIRSPQVIYIFFVEFETSQNHIWRRQNKNIVTMARELVTTSVSRDIPQCPPPSPCPTFQDGILFYNFHNTKLENWETKNNSPLCFQLFTYYYFYYLLIILLGNCTALLKVQKHVLYINT